MNVIKKMMNLIEPVLIMIVAVALITFLYDFYILVNENTETGNARHLEELTIKNADSVRQKISSDLNTIYSISKYIASFDDIQGEEAKDAINHISKNLPFSILLVSTVEGSYFCSNDADINLKEPAYFLRSSNGDKKVSGIYRNALFGKDMIALTSPIYHDQTIIGNISGLYYTDSIKNVFYETTNGNSFFQIIERNGNSILLSDASTYLGEPNIYTLLGQAKMKGQNSFDQVVKDIYGGKMGTTHFEYQEKDLYLSYAPIGVNDWYLLSFTQADGLISSNDIKGSTLQLMERIILLFFILIIYIIWRQFKYKKVLIQNNENLERLNKQLKYDAENDLLTGLHNRVTSENLIAEYIETEGKTTRHALFVIDVDNFKSINDEMGHLNGDKVLEEAAAGFGNHFRANDIKGRIGGDEFIILLKEIQSTEDIIKKAENIRNIFKEINIVVDDVSMPVSASIGIAIYPDHGIDYRELFKKADIAMYHSKELGKDSYYIYSNDIEFNSILNEIKN